MPDAEVIVGLIGLIGALAALFVQNRKTHRDNRNDHGKSMEKIDVLHGSIHAIRVDQLDIKADVRETRDTLRDHHVRIRNLEDKP